MVALAQDRSDKDSCDESMVPERDSSSVSYVLQCIVPFSCDSKILSALLHLASPDCDPNIINEIYDQFGPNLRLCLENFSWPRGLEAYKAAVQRALMWVTPQSLRGMIEEAEDLTMEGIAEKLFLIRRSDTHNLESTVCVMPISDHIGSRLPI